MVLYKKSKLSNNVWSLISDHKNPEWEQKAGYVLSICEMEVLPDAWAWGVGLGKGYLLTNSQLCKISMSHFERKDTISRRK